MASKGKHSVSSDEVFDDPDGYSNSAYIKSGTIEKQPQKRYELATWANPEEVTIHVPLPVNPVPPPPTYPKVSYGALGLSIVSILCANPLCGCPALCLAVYAFQESTRKKQTSWSWYSLVLSIIALSISIAGLIFVIVYFATDSQWGRECSTDGIARCERRTDLDNYNW